MKRRIGYTILVFLFLAAAAFVYINNIFLPIQFKQIIIDKTRRFLGRDVTIGRITCGPIQGVNVHDIIIYQKNATGQPFIVVKTLSFKILLPPILKNQFVRGRQPLERYSMKLVILTHLLGVSVLWPIVGLADQYFFQVF